MEDWERDRASQKRKYPMINTDAVYPTDMYPYCETIGRRLRTKASYRSKKMLLTPFSTLRYFPTEENVKLIESTPAFMPPLFFPLIWWMPKEKIRCVLPGPGQGTKQLGP